MTRYRFSFINGTDISVDKPQFDNLMAAMTEDLDFELRGFQNDTGTIILNPNHIISIISEDVNDAQSTITVPPTPAELRAEKDLSEQNKDVSLDAQLNNPDL